MWLGLREGLFQPRPVLKPICKMELPQQAEAFRRALATWFDRDGKDYPWRRTTDPYEILVSEMMLQQTQIATVLGRGFYTRFLDAFPDTRTLAAAQDEELLKAWEGLGYYRRVRMLREAARTIESEHGGRFPETLEEILALPGVGRYTVGAVVSFAFNRPAPIVDGNVARVLSRLMDFSDKIEGAAAQRQLWAWAAELLDESASRVHNSALMELGQTYCRPGVPDCLACPVSSFCKCREPEALPVKGKRVKLTEVEESVVFVLKGGRVLLRQQKEGRRVGMWRLPEREIEKDWPLVHERKYGITRYRVTLKVHEGPLEIRAAQDEAWHSIESLEDRVMPPADRAAVEALLGSGEEIA